MSIYRAQLHKPFFALTSSGST